MTDVASFIGSNLCKRIIDEQSDTKVIGIDNLYDYYDVQLKCHRLSLFKYCRNFEFRKGDIADKGFLNEIFEEYKPEIVVNLALQAVARYSITNPGHSYKKILDSPQSQTNGNVRC